MDGCKKIPGAAWQLLAQAEWKKLTKANFAWRLGTGGVSKELLWKSKLMEGKAWGMGVGRSGGRPRCFEESGEGSAVLLSVLGGCHQLQDSAEFARLLSAHLARRMAFPRCPPPTKC